MLYIIIKYAVVILTTIILSRAKCTDLSSAYNSIWAKPMQWMRWTVEVVFRNQLELDDKIIGKRKDTHANKEQVKDGNASEEQESSSESQKPPIDASIEETSQKSEEANEKSGGKASSIKASNEDDRQNLVDATTANVPGEQGKESQEPAIQASINNPTQESKEGKGKSNCSRSIIILFTIIATFGLLAVGSALDLTLFSVTHACTEDPNIDCYPRPIRDAKDAGLNITTDKPIEDCGPWNSEGVSDKVTFVCYQFVLNVELFLAVIGGLSTVFVFTMRATIKVLLSISVRIYNYCTGKCGKCLKAVWYVLVVITSAIELLLAIMGMVLGATGTSVDSTNDTPEVVFLATHATEILLVFGIIATLLWLPWDKYAKNHKEELEN